MRETWRPITGYEGSYEVSDQGRVRSLDRIVVNSPSSKHPNGAKRQLKGRMLSITIQPNGYAGVHIRPGNPKLIHLLVLEAFHGPRPKGMECRHLNGDPLNNRLDNLAWGSRKENAGDRTRHGRTYAGMLNGNSKLTDQQVQAIRSSEKTYREIAHEFGLTRAWVWRIRAGIVWKTGNTYLRGRPRKLTDEQVVEIRQSAEQGRTLAKRFGIAESHISAIRRGRRRVPIGDDPAKRRQCWFDR